MTLPNHSANGRNALLRSEPAVLEPASTHDQGQSSQRDRETRCLRSPYLKYLRGRQNLVSDDRGHALLLDLRAANLTASSPHDSYLSMIQNRTGLGVNQEWDREQVGMDAGEWLVR
jgi:hypothetical protein